jgi:hypothetical protein
MSTSRRRVPYFRKTSKAQVTKQEKSIETNSHAPVIFNKKIARQHQVIARNVFKYFNCQTCIILVFILIVIKNSCGQLPIVPTANFLLYVPCDQKNRRSHDCHGSIGRASLINITVVEETYLSPLKIN